MIKAIIHHSDSPHGRGTDAAEIHSWHLERNFDGIGYHYVVLEDGTVQAGRPIYWEGAHAKGHNDALGICLIGKSYFAPEQYIALSELLRELEINDDEVIGHCDVSAKTCPNFDVKEFLKFRKKYGF